MNKPLTVSGASLLTSTIFLATMASPSIAAPKANASCATRKCHKSIFKGKVLHGPVEAGRCLGCHPPKGKLPKGAHKRGAFRTIRKNSTCTPCHKSMIKGRVVHKPLKTQGCLHCHEAHSSNTRGLLRAKSERELCMRCHKKTKLKFPFVHGPVAGGACSVCHASHASNNKHLLIATGTKLCFSCHESKRFVFKHKHKAVKNGCISCHAPHGGKQKFFVRQDTNTLCGKCHVAVAKVAKTAKYKHVALQKKGCGDCHSPHGGHYAKLLKRSPLKTCTSCHPKRAQGKYKHGPVADGNCTPCHKPHGSNYPHLMTAAFPEEFYGPFKKKRYGICFDCHESDIVKDRYTTTLTKFRDGKVNMHYLHHGIFVRRSPLAASNGNSL
ncbi:MAG: hypothetical protein JRH20_15340 [Deltaproteobacteria bacterium]|nr:hypothetical protein [Deltaproteobacteria bacterium]